MVQSDGVEFPELSGGRSKAAKTGARRLFAPYSTPLQRCMHCVHEGKVNDAVLEVRNSLVSPKHRGPEAVQQAQQKK